MKLIIYNKDDYNKNFIYNYLPKEILKLFNYSYSKINLKKFDEEFNINSIQIIRFALSNLRISEQINSYIIEIDKNKRYNNNNIDSLINVITYGNRTCKGYPIVYKIFDFIAKNIDKFYEEWLDGN